MIFYNDELKIIGGSKKIQCYRATADTADEFLSLVNHLQRKSPRHTFPRLMEKGEINLRSKMRPIVFFEEEAMTHVRDLEPILLSEPYFNLASWLLRMHVLVKYEHIRPDWADKVTYLRGVSQKYCNEVLKSGAYVKYPGSLDERSQIGIKFLNSWIEKFDLGQHKRLNTDNYLDYIENLERKRILRGESENGFKTTSPEMDEELPSKELDREDPPETLVEYWKIDRSNRIRYMESLPDYKRYILQSLIRDYDAAEPPEWFHS